MKLYSPTVELKIVEIFFLIMDPDRFYARPGSLWRPMRNHDSDPYFNQCGSTSLEKCAETNIFFMRSALHLNVAGGLP